MPRKYVAVCGASDATASQLASAREVGRLLAEAGVVVINGGRGGVSWAAGGGASGWVGHGAVAVINGGLGGVSGAASEGASEAGGPVFGVLPDTDRLGANANLT